MKPKAIQKKTTQRKTGANDRPRIIVSFSGQMDSMESVYGALHAYPDTEILLLYAKGIGIRGKSSLPLDAARSLAQHYPQIRQLITTDAADFIAAALKLMPPALGQKLGMRGMCLSCQSSLWLILCVAAEYFQASVMDFKGEDLGHDINDALTDLKKRTLDTRLAPALRIAVTDIDAVTAPRSQRCALADLHGNATVPPSGKLSSLIHYNEQFSALLKQPLSAPTELFEIIALAETTERTLQQN